MDELILALAMGTLHRVVLSHGLCESVCVV